MIQKWCEHIKGQEGTIYTTINYDFGRCSTSVPFYINFCPICGTPRPKEKSLEEKLEAVFNSHSHETCELHKSSHCSVIKHLAETAEAHFKEKP